MMRLVPEDREVKIVSAKLSSKCHLGTLLDAFLRNPSSRTEQTDTIQLYAAADASIEAHGKANRE